VITYAYIVQVVGPVPMPEQTEWDAYEDINDTYLEAVSLGQVPVSIPRYVQVGAVEVLEGAEGLFVHRIGWYINDPSDTPISGSPYLLNRPLSRADFADE